MKLTSASDGARAGVSAADGERILLLFPGAPGCTMGAGMFGGFPCWPDAVAALRKTKARLCQAQDAMSKYTTCGFAGQSIAGKKLPRLVRSQEGSGSEVTYRPPRCRFQI
jgi:hypothetical protein